MDEPKSGHPSLFGPLSATLTQAGAPQIRTMFSVFLNTFGDGKLSAAPRSLLGNPALWSKVGLLCFPPVVPALHSGPQYCIPALESLQRCADGSRGPRAFSLGQTPQSFLRLFPTWASPLGTLTSGILSQRPRFSMAAQVGADRTEQSKPGLSLLWILPL